MYQVNYCGFNLSNPDYDMINRPNGSGDYIFLYFLTPMKVYLESETIITKKNACILYDINYMQKYCAIKKFTNSFFHFSTSEDFIHEFKLPVNQVFYPSNYPILNELMKNIYIEYMMKDDYYQVHIDATIQQLFVHLAREIYQSEKSKCYEEGLYKQFHEARIQILTNIEKDWTIDSMASLTNLGKSQFYHYYQLFFRRSPKSELIEARIERAKYLLSNDTLTISQVAVLSGFMNVNHFTRYFKKCCGCTPSLFRLQR
jgi:AraC-like DNA-binding protein